MGRSNDSDPIKSECQWLKRLLCVFLLLRELIFYRRGY